MNPEESRYTMEWQSNTLGDVMSALNRAGAGYTGGLLAGKILTDVVMSANAEGLTPETEQRIFFTIENEIVENKAAILYALVHAFMAIGESDVSQALEKARQKKLLAEDAQQFDSQVDADQAVNWTIASFDRLMTRPYQGRLQYLVTIANDPIWKTEDGERRLKNDELERRAKHPQLGEKMLSAIDEWTERLESFSVQLYQDSAETMPIPRSPGATDGEQSELSQADLDDLGSFLHQASYFGLQHDLLLQDLLNPKCGKSRASKLIQVSVTDGLLMTFLQKRFPQLFNHAKQDRSPADQENFARIQRQLMTFMQQKHRTAFDLSKKNPGILQKANEFQFLHLARSMSSLLSLIQWSPESNTPAQTEAPEIAAIPSYVSSEIRPRLQHGNFTEWSETVAGEKNAEKGLNIEHLYVNAGVYGNRHINVSMTSGPLKGNVYDFTSGQCGIWQHRLGGPASFTDASLMPIDVALKNQPEIRLMTRSLLSSQDDGLKFLDLVLWQLGIIEQVRQHAATIDTITMLNYQWSDGKGIQSLVVSKEAAALLPLPAPLKWGNLKENLATLLKKHSMYIPPSAQWVVYNEDHGGGNDGPDEEEPPPYSPTEPVAFEDTEGVLVK